MKVAVVQHRLRESMAADVEALLASAQSAQQAGAGFVVFPEVPVLSATDSPHRAMFFARLAEIPGDRLIAQLEPGALGFAGLGAPPEGLDGLGTLALLVGDACADVAEIERLAASVPDLAVLLPRSESELQAEAFLELAIALSDSLAGLVLVAETTGGEFGEPGHGGSAIISCGKVLAEAVGDEEVLIAEVDVPLAQPEPRDALPVLPPILAQRWASHRGERPVFDYPADLSGSGA